MIKKYAYINQTTGEIQTIVSPYLPNQQVSDGDIVGGLLVKELQLPVNNSEFIQTKFWDGSAWQDRIRKPSGEYKWDGTNHTWIVDTDLLWQHIRAKRDGLLAKSDWAVLPDITHPTGLDTQWETYRTTLRDLPTTQSSVTSFNDVVWPTEPS